MAGVKIPGIVQLKQNAAGPVQQPRADADTLVPGWRQVEQSYRSAGEAQDSVYQANETDALSQQRADLAQGKIGESIGELTDPVEKRYKQMQLSDAQLEATNTRAYQTQRLITTLKNATPDDIKNPSFVSDFLQSYDDQTSGIVDNYDTPEAKMQMVHSLAEGRAELGTHMMTVMGEKVGQLAVQNVKDGQTNRTSIAQANPAFAPGQVRDMERDIDNTIAMHNMDPVEGMKLKADLGKGIVEAMGKGYAQSNPERLAAQMDLQPKDRDPLFQGLVGKYLDGDMAAKMRSEGLTVFDHRQQLQRVAAAEKEKAGVNAANAQAVDWMQQATRMDTGADAHTKLGDLIGHFDFKALPDFKPGEIHSILSANETFARLKEEPRPDSALAMAISTKIIHNDPDAIQNIRQLDGPTIARLGYSGVQQVKNFLEGSSTESGRATNLLYQKAIQAADKLVDKLPDGTEDTTRKEAYLVDITNAIDAGYDKKLSLKTMMTPFLPGGKTINPDYVPGIIHNYDESISERTARLIRMNSSRTVGLPTATSVSPSYIPGFMKTPADIQAAADAASKHANELTRLSTVKKQQDPGILSDMWKTIPSLGSGIQYPKNIKTQAQLDKFNQDRIDADRAETERVKQMPHPVPTELK